MGRFGLYLRAMPLMLMLAGSALAVETPAAPAVPSAPEARVTPAIETPWQDVVTGQIEAFRARNASGAFQYAAAGFQTAFPNAEAFFAAIIGSGYAPIMDSTSHSFGEFTRLDEHSVAQMVTLTAKNLTRFEAIYLLTEEAGGWRVSGVQLAKTPGISV